MIDRISKLKIVFAIMLIYAVMYCGTFFIIYSCLYVINIVVYLIMNGLMIIWQPMDVMPTHIMTIIIMAFKIKNDMIKGKIEQTKRECGWYEE